MSLTPNCNVALWIDPGIKKKDIIRKKKLVKFTTSMFILKNFSKDNFFILEILLWLYDVNTRGYKENSSVV